MVSCLKIVRIQKFSGPHFPAFGLNMEIYSVNLLIQSKREKYGPKKTPNTDTFYTVVNCANSVILNLLNHLSIITKFTKYSPCTHDVNRTYMIGSEGV